MGIEQIPIFSGNTWVLMGINTQRIPWIPIFCDGNLLISHQTWLVVDLPYAEICAVNLASQKLSVIQYIAVTGSAFRMDSHS